MGRCVSGATRRRSRLAEAEAAAWQGRAQEMWGESKEDDIDGDSGSGGSVLRIGMRKGMGKLSKAVLSKASLAEQLLCIQNLEAIVQRAMDDGGGSKGGEIGAKAGVVVEV